MPRKDTEPELALRRELHRLGLRYVLDVRALPGRPDVVFTRRRIAVFIDGCFWHRCPTHFVQPKSNSDWWTRKLAANVERDRLADERLTSLGWAVLRVWEHEDPVVAAQVVLALWREREDG